VTIRDATVADRDALYEVHRAAFRRAAEAEVAVALDAEISLVAEEGGRIVGSVILSRLVDVGVRALALGPIGVLPAAQGRGVGSALVRAALDRAAAAGEDAVLLLGDPRYYARFGFEPAAAYGAEDRCGWGDAFQVVVLAAPPRRGAWPLWPRAFLAAGTPPEAIADATGKAGDTLRS
jgi:putative acetyltransferase